jgi:hypothetical protein
MYCIYRILTSHAYVGGFVVIDRLLRLLRTDCGGIWALETALGALTACPFER